MGGVPRRWYVDPRPINKPTKTPKQKLGPSASVIIDYTLGLRRHREGKREVLASKVAFVGVDVVRKRYEGC